MRILFSMRHLGSFRLYEAVLRRLAAAGHDIQVTASRRDRVADSEEMGWLPDVPGIRWVLDDVRLNRWIEIATMVRIWLDYLHCFKPAYAGAPRLRSRAAERVPAALRRITAWPVVRSATGCRTLAAILRIVERALPRQEAFDALVRKARPDVVLLTPLLHLGSPQVELLRSARAYGATTVLCVGSWDHLSSKSLIREVPDRIFVWNETQKQEAEHLHGLETDRVVVTGAQCYDQWFDRRPERSRKDFCAAMGLPPDRLLLLWVCSALFVGSPSEARFVRRWIEAVRASENQLLASAAVLVRPHPARWSEWNDGSLAGLPDVALHGALPLDETSRRDYFEAFHYSAAVVGLNTSAFLEAAIAGKPVHTVLLPEFADNQEGTLHFHYLQRVGGGLLRVARGFDEHRAQLTASLLEGERPDRNIGFVRAFIRPYGLERSATDVFVERLERLESEPVPAPARPSVWTPALRLALAPLALAAHAWVGWTSSPSDRTVFELRRAKLKDEHRQTREADERRHQTSRDAARAEKARQAEQARREAQRRRESRLLESAREKLARRETKERNKRRRTRAKRVAALVARLKYHMGIGQQP